MADPVKPAAPRGADARGLFRSGCFGYLIAAVLFIAGVVLVTAGQLPALILIALAIVVGVLARLAVRKAEPNVR